MATKPPLLSSSHPHHGGKGLLASRNSFLAGGEQHLQPWKNFKVFLTKKVDLLQLLETESQAYEAYFYHFCWHFAWIFQRTPPAECLPCKWVHLPEWQVCQHGEQMWQCGGEHFVHFVEMMGICNDSNHIWIFFIFVSKIIGLLKSPTHWYSCTKDNWHSWREKCVILD